MQHPLTLDLHAEGVHVEFDQRLFFLTLVRVLLAQADDGADRLGVVAFSTLLGFVTDPKVRLDSYRGRRATQIAL